MTSVRGTRSDELGLWGGTPPPVVQRIDGWRRTVTSAALLLIVAGLGFAAVVGVVALAVLAMAAPLLVLLALGALAFLVLRRQGGLMAVAAALWHLADTWERRL